MIVGVALVAGLVVVAAILDVRTRRIPNALSAAVALVALGIHAPLGWAAAGQSALAMALVLAFGTGAFAAGWFGGGDVKLLSACAGVAGMQGLVPMVLAVFLAGGVLTIGVAIRDGRFGALLRSTAGVAAGAVPVERTCVPYAVAIAAGVICSFALSIPLR